MKVYCNNCKNYTNHSVLKKEENRWGNDDICGSDTYQIIQCKGCERISFSHEYVDSDIYEPIIYQYPESSMNKLTINRDIPIPRKVKKIYEETIMAYNNGQNILCAVGLRAIVEGICLDRELPKGNLQSKIENLDKKGFLTESHANILHQSRFLGNDAVHELEIPYSEELKIAIEIIEHTLQNIYELSDKQEYLEFIRKKRKNK